MNADRADVNEFFYTGGPGGHHQATRTFHRDGPGGVGVRSICTMHHGIHTRHGLPHIVGLHQISPNNFNIQPRQPHSLAWAMRHGPHAPVRIRQQQFNQAAT